MTDKHSEEFSASGEHDFHYLLARVQDTAEKLKAAEEELRTLRRGEEEDDRRIEQVLLTIKEIETSNKFMKDFLYRTLKWTILILSLVISIMLTIIGASASIIVKNLKLFLS